MIQTCIPRRELFHFLSLIAFVAFCANLPLGSAQDQESKTVIEIVLEGNVRVNPTLIRDNLKTREGEAYDDQLARDDVDMLFERFNLMASFCLEEMAGGVRVIISLREELRIRKIEIRGLGSSDREKVEKKLGIKEGVFPNRYMLKSLSLKARDHFREQGYYFAEVNTVLEPVEDGVLLVFNVYKGDKVVIEEVIFHGIQEVEEGELFDQLEGTAPVLWLFTDKLKEDVLGKDLARLNQYLMEEGYLDGRVTLDGLDFNDEFDEVKINYRVQEGKRYKVNSVSVEGCEAFFPDQIHELIRIGPGDPFRTVKIDADIRRIQRFYKDRGYFRAEIYPPERRFQEDRSVVDLVYKIKEHQQKSVRDVVISGNALTQDKVIRREITLNPGDLLNHSELRWSINKLVGLQFFNDREGMPHVEVDPRITDDPQLEDI
ncbi:MAG: POTRA domain-containing protein, partial [Planctomycetota bacterium]